MATPAVHPNPVKPVPNPVSSSQTVSVAQDTGFSFDLKKIKENVLGNRKVEVIAKTEEENFEPVDHEVFEKAWPAWLEHIHTQNLIALHTPLKNVVPKFVTGKVVLIVGSLVVKNMIIEEKLNMMNFLVGKFGLKPFVLEILVEQLPELESQKYGTDSEKLKHLISKNEAFKEMVERFDLKIDY